MTRNPPNYWTKERCSIEALKYKTKSELYNKSATCYSQSLKNNWLDDICSHMIIQGNLYKRLIYSYEFSDKSVYVGLTYDIDKRQKSRDKDKNDSVTQYIEKTGLVPIRKILTEFLEIEIASKMEGIFLSEYLNNGWKILNRCKTGSLGGNNGIIISKWDEQNCLDSASKYNTRSDWQKNEYTAYNSARKIGDEFFKKCCKHMVYLQHKEYTYTDFKTICDKYSKLSDFIKNDKTIYQCLLRYPNWFKILTNHMIRMRKK